MNLIDVIFGSIATLLIIVIILMCLKDYYTRRDTLTIVDPTLSGEYQKLKNAVHCPDCNSYNVILVDDNAGVPWLKGKISELDHYRCNHCGREFEDENWQDAKHYINEYNDD